MDILKNVGIYFNNIFILLVLTNFIVLQPFNCIFNYRQEWKEPSLSCINLQQYEILGINCFYRYTVTRNRIKTTTSCSWFATNNCWGNRTLCMSYVLFSTCSANERVILIHTHQERALLACLQVCHD